MFGHRGSGRSLISYGVSQFLFLVFWEKLVVGRRHLMRTLCVGNCSLFLVRRKF